MQDYPFPEETVDELVLKYSDETFSIRDVIKFEMLLKYNPEYSKMAQINRKIRRRLRALPKVKAAAGFESRLADRIHMESHY